ncbi:mannitol dehydrogenase family protein [Actinobacteria bacterium YIM 96077]|uniref:Mannitol-1-phosphate 5-dehydrogenase n=1 Tax=Phytoactinopolyspora halophila TaxID=1981511 RepID=A0A329QS19_9ACTN|nr:mannitol dehydrogenase family protein [Phytoactinopolyspora halophila]AYY15053.1 mannitol dehydrogenase family protein [Actinobacteria bacterium YIM 96077]RAW14182.1 mannitol dehydrogenase family protein [Phytoactinopolyspora halophila]
MSTASQRLGLASLGRVRAGGVPGYDPRAIEAGIVHLGVGAFFRAHQAAYTHELLQEGHHAWGICGFSQRSDTVPGQLAPQDGLYSLLVRDAITAPRLQVMGALRDVRCAAHEPETVVEKIAAPSVHAVTLTVSEKGYRQDPATNGLRIDDEVAADLGGQPPRTVVGQLVRGLQRRRAGGGAPIAIISCDNLTSNGAMLRRLVLDFVDRLPATERGPLGDWIATQVAFPNTMVDRIVPATSERDRAEVEELMGLRDEGVVVAEPFTQWVIEDAFTGARPPWELAGAVLTDDVERYERVKLRLLNAAHSLVAYLGVLMGHDTIAEAVADERIRGAVLRLLNDDQIPTVTPPPDVDLSSYRDEVLHRFANPALGHRTAQVAMDGSKKLPQRLLGALRQRRADGALPRYGALLIAAWMRALSAERADGSIADVGDPEGDTVRRLLASARNDHEAVRDVLGIRSVFGPDLSGDEELVEAVAEFYTALGRHGVDGALRAVGG